MLFRENCGRTLLGSVFRATTRFLIGITTSAFTVSTIGCSGATTSASADQTHRHVAPPCLSGETVAHTFKVTNRTGDELSLPEVGGIDQSCGCTSARAGAVVWKAGSSNDITVAVETSGKRGEIRERATLNWRNPAGDVVPIHFYIESEVIGAVDTDPPAVLLRESEGGGAPKAEVAFRSPLDIDWSTLQCVTLGNRFRFTKTGESRGDVELVESTAKNKASFKSETLSFNVRVSDGASRMAGKVLLVTLPCSAHLRVPVSISPEQVVVHLRQETGTAEGRFLLRGDVVPGLVKHGFELRSAAGRIAHRFVQAGADQLIVTFTLAVTAEAKERSHAIELVRFEPEVTVCEIPLLIDESVAAAKSAVAPQEPGL